MYMGAVSLTFARTIYTTSRALFVRQTCQVTASGTRIKQPLKLVYAVVFS